MLASKVDASVWVWPVMGCSGSWDTKVLRSASGICASKALLSALECRSRNVLTRALKRMVCEVS